MDKFEELRAFIMRVRAMMLDHHLHHEAGGSDPVDLGGYVTKALFDANSILAANADNTPLALVIAASRILGRGAAGDIAALTGAQIMAILTGQAGADFSMNTHKITNVVDPAANQDAATKKYVDDAAPAAMPRVRGYLAAVQTNLPTGKICRIQVINTTFDTESGWKTGTWQAGVGDAGSNATTIIDANPTSGTGFVAAMRYALVTWDAGASTGYIVTVNSATSLTIIKNLGTNFAVGDTYTIAKAHYEVPTSGYWLFFGLVGWLWSSVTANIEYGGDVTVNGVLEIVCMMQAAAVKPLSNPFSDIKHLNSGDIVAMGAHHYDLINVADVNADADGRNTYLAMALLEAD